MELVSSGELDAHILLRRAFCWVYGHQQKTLDIYLDGDLMFNAHAVSRESVSNVKYNLSDFTMTKLFTGRV